MEGKGKKGKESAKVEKIWRVEGGEETKREGEEEKDSR